MSPASISAEPIDALSTPAAPALLARARELAARNPGWTALAGVLLFAFVWLLELACTSMAPPVDNVEQLVWIRQLAWGYYKHPPLPTFLMWLAVHVTGLNAWTSYLLGAATILGGMALFWRLLRELRGVRYANIALLATLCITFYNGRLNWYNHNTVLLVEVAAAALFTWRAFERRQLRWWLAIGVTLGLGAITKYEIAISGLSLALFWLAQRGWRERMHRLGALLALLVALLIFTPHLLWLHAHDFGPVAYAMESSLGVSLSPAERSLHTLAWLLDEVFNRAAPALLLLGAMYWKTRGRKAVAAAGEADPQRRRASRQLLLAWGLVPLLFMPALGLVTGAELQLQWGTPFLLFLVPCVMELAAPGRWDRASQGAAWAGFAALQVLLLAINIVTSPLGPFADDHWRKFSAERLEEAIVPEARRRLGGPIRVIVGPIGDAGALALVLPGQPLVLIDGRYDHSPWVSPELLATCGALQLLRTPTPGPGLTASGPPFQNLYWRVLRPAANAAGCSAQPAP